MAASAYARRVSFNERLYLAAERRQPGFCIQLVLEMEGELSAERARAYEIEINNFEESYFSRAVEGPTVRFLDALIGGQELWTGVVPKIGRKFIQVVTIEGFPLESTPGMLTALGELACEYRWSSRFMFLDAIEARQKLERTRKKWQQKVRPFFDQLFQTQSRSVDQDAAAMVAEAEDAIAQASSQLVAYGYYTPVIVIFDEDCPSSGFLGQQAA